MRVTIVTPSFNQAKFLERTIQSVLNQDYDDLEYIIIDGGSDDGSVDIIRKYEDRLAYWISEKDLGQTDAINKGFAKASGEVLAWLNSDDTYEPGAIKEAVIYLEEHPEVGLLYGDGNFIDTENRIIGQFPSRQTDYQRLRNGYVHICQQSAFFRADLWRKVAPLDPSFYFAMDYDLWVRLANISEVKYVQKLWANFRLHGDTKTVAEDDRCWPEMVRVHRRDGGSWFSLIMIKYLIRKIVAPIIRWRRKKMFSR
ncbi:MAG: glycosyltransferase [Anaerolineaceae bacterium]|nr:glycosyltransferase [Anaerolineaceae bacterium]